MTDKTDLWPISRRDFALGLAGSAAAATLLHPVPALAQDWKARWDKVVAAAEKEGLVDIAGPSGRQWQQLLSDFTRDYPKIKARVTPFDSRDFWPRLLKEREVGKHLWDIRVGGADTQVYPLAKEGGLADVRAMFILPEVAGENNWYGGFDHMFLDNAKKYVPSFGAYESPLAHTNRAFIKDGEIKDIRELLLPRWKGKIAMANPRGGSTAVSMALVYKKIGPEFIRELFTTQKPVIVKNARQLMDWFVSGKYPIGIGLPNVQIVAYRKRGIDIDMGKIEGLDIWSVGVNGIQVINPRPHPNASIVFVNWLLTQKTQARIMPQVVVNSRRKDVPVVDKHRELDWKNYRNSVSGQTEDLTQAMLDAKNLIRELVN
ncbi:MAG: hypothetical protein RL477_1124 [Pseudomonadota bacterium]|jgi:iron(III) transport system substrate-binding protein